MGGVTNWSCVRVSIWNGGTGTTTYTRTRRSDTVTTTVVTRGDTTVTVTLSRGPLVIETGGTGHGGNDGYTSVRASGGQGTGDQRTKVCL